MSNHRAIRSSIQAGAVSQDIAGQTLADLADRGQQERLDFMVRSLRAPQQRPAPALQAALASVHAVARFQTTASVTAVASGSAQLLPASDFATRDGRPGPGRMFRLDNQVGQLLANTINTVSALTPVLIDYDHATLHSKDTGRPAPAAGWIKAAEWRPGRGLFALVDWTPPAAQLIAAAEYRYISPVITYGPGDRITGIPLAALTNFPAILGMAPVGLDLPARPVSS